MQEAVEGNGMGISEHYRLQKHVFHEGSEELVIGVQLGNYSKLTELIYRNGAKLLNTISMDGRISAVVVEIPSEAKPLFVAELNTKGLLRYIEPNMQFKLDFSPNDQYWKLQWAHRKIGVDYAWNTTTGNKSLLIAIIDTGIDYNHPDLAANYAALGYDWVNNDNDPMDDHGHGTHCAGIIAAEINNSIGTAGLAQVRIMAEKAFNQFGEGWEDDLANAIIHAVDQGAKIISNSWGSSVESALIHDAIAYAYSHGVLVIGAAGNDASNFKHYPAAYEEVVAVSATDEADDPTSFTNFGDWIEIAAPGLNILSTFWDDTYCYMSGTSMSAPHVAGIAALIWDRFPWMTCDQVRAQLRYTADDLGDLGFDIYYGYGRVNARRAVEQNPPQHDLVIWEWQKPSYVRPGERVLINATIFNYGIYNETNILVQLQVNDSIVDSDRIDFLQTGMKGTVCLSWTTGVEGVYVITCNVVPLIGDENIENNALSEHVRVVAPRVIEVPKDYKSIQKAVDTAHPGDTVRVASGVYYEHVTISKSLTLIGEERSSCIIDGSGYGTVIQVLAPYVNVYGFTVRNGDFGIYLSSSSWNNTIANNIISKNSEGLVLMYSSHNTLRNNNMTDNKLNFNLVGDSPSDFANDIDASNTVNGKPVYYWVKQYNRMIPLDAGYAAVIDSTNITVKDLTLKNNGQGVLFAYTQNCVIEHVNASSNRWGILLIGSNGDNIFDNNLKNNEYNIDLWNCRNTFLIRNSVSEGTDGIYLWRSDKNTITNNTVTDNTRFGVLVELSTANTLSNNIVSNNTKGAILAWSSFNTMRKNDINSNTHNFGVYGSNLWDFIQNIEISNTINGLPIYYLVNRTGLTINSTMFPNIGYLGLINSTNIIVEDAILTNNEQGILLAYTNDSTIEKTNASNNAIGIYIYASKDNKIIGNKLAGNENNGVSLHFSTNNTVGGNVITDNQEIGINIEASTGNTLSKNTVSSNMLSGVRLRHSSGNQIVQNALSSNRRFGVEIDDFSNNNTIIQNDIVKNLQGIGLDKSIGNSIYHNNFIDNTYQAVGIDFWMLENLWDNKREEGNYWSDYAGKDLNGDGIGDTEIPHLGVDYYPLMNPYILGDVDHDGTVNIIDIAIVAWSFNSHPQHARWNPHADLNNDNFINILDVATVACNLGKKWKSF
jgi:thermitase